MLPLLRRRTISLLHSPVEDRMASASRHTCKVLTSDLTLHVGKYGGTVGSKYNAVQQVQQRVP